ncbi:RdgB/HAM1 family non-canonical purine NTP pyrophosphatase [Sediminibacterium sp.]|uniref:RdgB/HAM1 family non-canonical purine NTP pyrophosphatase n=1 Tax=Sediminibacterium sp. TaxID=1917865 RepID=UPI003F6A2A89
MPTEIIFATNNANKVKEIKAVTGNLLTILSLEESGIFIDIPEPHDTLEANASEKSKVIHQLTGKNCFSEDTGLEVVALNGAPGVKSARYAGDTRDFQANIDLLLNNLLSHTNKSAQFRTVISLIWNNQEYLFEGICKGQITHQSKGLSGFGYDPVFIPDGADKTFAEMSMEEKNQYSHRKKAMQQLIDFFHKNGIA